MSIPAFIRSLLPRDNQFFGFLERQAAVAVQAAEALSALKQGGKRTEIRRNLAQIERDGDQAVKEMLDALARTFVTPIDRDDLQKLSKRLDDITDKINLAARASELFGVAEPSRPMVLLLDALLACTHDIDGLVGRLRSGDYKNILAEAGRITERQREGDEVFRDALRELFHDPAVDAKTILRDKEILEDLEKALNHCEQCAELLTNIAVKHG